MNIDKNAYIRKKIESSMLKRYDFRHFHWKFRNNSLYLHHNITFMLF
jgi:hypothetical protein